MKDSVDALQCRVDARSVAQIARDCLVRSQITHAFGFGRVVHERPDLQALRHEGRNDEPGELAGCPDGEHPHVAVRSRESDDFVRLPM
jgi:hypothetical protein